MSTNLLLWLPPVLFWDPRPVVRNVRERVFPLVRLAPWALPPAKLSSRRGWAIADSHIFRPPPAFPFHRHFRASRRPQYGVRYSGNGHPPSCSFLNAKLFFWPPRHGVATISFPCWLFFIDSGEDRILGLSFYPLPTKVRFVKTSRRVSDTIFTFSWVVYDAAGNGVVNFFSTFPSSSDFQISFGRPPNHHHVPLLQKLGGLLFRSRPDGFPFRPPRPPPTRLQPYEVPFQPWTVAEYLTTFAFSVPPSGLF